MSLIITIIVIALLFYLIPAFNRRVDEKIEKDIYQHFTNKGLNIVSLEKLTTASLKNAPFKIPRFTPSTGFEKNYFADNYWKLTIADKADFNKIIWVNSGHLFLWKMYLIEKKETEG